MKKLIPQLFLVFLILVGCASLLGVGYVQGCLDNSELLEPRTCIVPIAGSEVGIVYLERQHDEGFSRDPNYYRELRLPSGKVLKLWEWPEDFINIAIKADKTGKPVAVYFRGYSGTAIVDLEKEELHPIDGFDREENWKEVKEPSSLKSSFTADEYAYAGRVEYITGKGLQFVPEVQQAHEEPPSGY